MDSLFILSDEPALAETLASVLPGCSVTQATRHTPLPAGLPRLVILDAGLSNPFAAQNIPAVTVKRPVRLRDLLYTIHGQLQSKTVSQEMALSPRTRFLPHERVLRAEDGRADIALTEKEVELLSCLLENEGGPIARDALLKRVWGYSDDITTHTLETHIYRLRGKLRQAEESLDIAFYEDGGYRLMQG